MNYRKFGSTELNVSEIGFGCWGIGGNSQKSLSYGPTKDRDSIAALKRSYELGVNFFDTSPLYGLGHSEKIIGKTFKNTRTNIIIASKVGYLDFQGNQDFTKKNIINSIEKSLKRLQTDYIDLFQLHDPEIKTLHHKFEIISTLKSLQKEGKLRYFGITLKSPTEKIDFNNFPFYSIQANFNLTDQRILENNILSKCKKNNLAFISRTPLSFGLLSGLYSDYNFDPTDHRSRFSKKQIDLWSSANKLFIKENNITKSQFAINFCLSFNEISTVIPGMLNVKQVNENLKSVSLKKFTKKKLVDFYKIYKKNNFFIK